MNAPTRQFSEAEKGKYYINKAIVVSHGETARGWATALLTIKTTETYTIDAPTWEDWCSKFIPWSIRTLEKVFSEERKSLAAHAGEVVVKPKPVRKVESLSLNKIRGSIKPPASCGASNGSPETNKPDLPKPEDDMGTIIPKPILDIWNRRQELQEVVTAISNLKCLIQRKHKEQDKLFAKLDQSVTDKLQAAYYAAANAMPYCVCGVCEGRLEVLPDGMCRACHSTGFMSKEDYRRLVPEEKQKIRIKGIELRKSANTK